MNPLTPDQVAALQASLEQRRLALLRQVAAGPNSESNRTPAVEEIETSPADNASNRTLNQLEAEAEDLRQAQLSAIRHALAKFDTAGGDVNGDHGDHADHRDQGNFGDCESCGEPIGWSRLEARPEARFCIACQTRLEQGRR